MLFEVEHKSAIIKKEWLRISKSQKLVEIPIEEKFRGNFCVHFMFIRNGRVYRHSATVSVPWTNKQLQFSFESFRSKLLPGQKEEWRIKITGKKREIPIVIAIHITPLHVILIAMTFDMPPYQYV